MEPCEDREKDAYTTSAETTKRIEKYNIFYTTIYHSLVLKIFLHFNLVE